MSTRTLLTSLSPHPTYQLGNALGVADQEQSTDHASTLLYPPRVQLIKLRDCEALRPRGAYDDWDQDDEEESSRSRWYALYHAADSLAFRELEAARSDYEAPCVYASSFNAYPSAHAVWPDAEADDEIEGSRGAGSHSHTQQRDAADALCVAGFSNGALLLFSPFRERLRAAAGLLSGDHGAEGPDDADEVDYNSAPAVSGQGAAASHSAAAAAAALARLPPADRALNTATTVLPMRVTCVAWEPSPLAWGPGGGPRPSAPCTRFVAGMADGRILVYDTRVDKEARLEHPPHPLAAAPAPGAPITQSSGTASKKSKSGLSAAAIAPAASAFALPPAPGVVPARELFSVVHAPLATPVAAGSTTQPLPASNPVSSWKVYAPPTASAIAARAASTSPVAATTAASLSPLALGINNPAHAGILALSFSASGAFLAASLSTGHIVVWEWRAARLVVCLRTRYGNALSLHWSSDERLLLSGGEDDNLCVWDPFGARALVIVGEGHASFVTAVHFRPVHFVQPTDPAAAAAAGSDPTAAAAAAPTAASNSTAAVASVWDGLYRVVSVGQDKLLLFWEFSYGGSGGDVTSNHGAADWGRTAGGERQAQAAVPAPAPAHSQRPSRRITWKAGEDLVKERSLSSVAAAAASTTATASTSSTESASSAGSSGVAAGVAAATVATGAASSADISALLIPAPRCRSSLRTIYPMAKNEASERALAHLDSGFGLRARRREQRRLWALRSPPPAVQSAVVFMPLHPSAAAGPQCELAARDDVLATVCHGLHLKFWTRADEQQQRQQQQREGLLAGQALSSRAAADSHLLHPPPSTPPSQPSSRRSGGSLTSRLQRLHTPILASASPPVATAADAAAASRSGAVAGSASASTTAMGSRRM